MMKKKLITVIIPTYNRADYIEETIQSVLNQTYQNFEIIVSDDGSTDNTKEIVESFNDRRIKYIFHENSGLPAVTRNRGIKQSSGEYIALLDSDDLWLPDKLKKQIGEFEKNGNIGLVCTKSFHFNKEKKWIQYKHLSEKDFTFKSLFLRNNIICSSVVIKKSVLDDVGLFNENPKIQSGEDYELWLRIAKKYEIKYVNIPLAKYRNHEEVIRKKDVERINMLINIYTSLMENKVIDDNLYRLIIRGLNSQKILSRLTTGDKTVDILTIVKTKTDFWNKYALMIVYLIFRYNPLFAVMHKL